MKVNNFWYATATLTGTIVGVGMFGLPFVASRAGFFVALAYLAVFAAVFVLLHLMFGEIMLRTNERHRFPGYAGLYVGKAAKRFLALVGFVGLSGGMLVYILVGATFLEEVTGNVLESVRAYQLVFWAAMSLMLLLGLRTVKESEFVMLALMVGIILFLFFASVPHLSADNFGGFSARDAFLPYGVTLFALAGGAAIPAVRDILKGEERAMRRAVTLGTLIPVFLYVLFVVAVLGVSGQATSENALSSLSGALGESVVFLGAALGILLVATSYLVFGLYLKDMLRYDMGVSGRLALGFVLFVPLALAFVPWDSFIEIIGFLGALIGGVEGIFLIMIWRRARARGDRDPEYALRVPPAALYALMCLFFAGIVYIMFFDGRV